MTSDLELLTGSPIFNGVESKDREALLSCLKIYSRAYRKGEYIRLEHDNIQDVGIVLKGTVHMLKEDVWGHQTLLAYMGPGELFGETFALLREQASNVSFLAAAETKVLFLPADRVLNPCKNHCPFHETLSRNFLLLLGKKNLRLMEKIEISSKSSLREKILAYLSIQAQKQGSKYIKIPLNRTEMASYLHANRSAMTRELADMQAEGLIEFDRNTFVIK